MWASTYTDEDMVSSLQARPFACAKRLDVQFGAVSYFFTCGTKVGKVKSLAMKCHPRLLGRQVLERYSSYVAVRWMRQMQER